MNAVSKSSSSVERLWTVVSDLDRWPHVLPTFDSLRLVEGEPRSVGARYEVRQPGMPAAIYEITEWSEGRSFTWQARSPGVLSTASHAVTANDDCSRLELAFDWSGPMAWLVRLIGARRARRMIESEAVTLTRLATGESPTVS